MSCASCGASLRLFEYQSRSADEAHTTAIKCPNCPIDIDRFNNPAKEPHVFLTIRTERPCLSKRSLVANKVHKRLVRLQSRTYDLGEMKPVDSRSSHVLDHSNKLFKVYSTGRWKGMSIHMGKQRRLSLNVTVEDVVVGECSDAGYTEYTDFRYIEVGEDIIIVEHECFTMCRIVECGTDDLVLDTIMFGFTHGFCPLSLTPYVSSILLGSISNLNARAYDASGASDQEHLFTSKPDGERMWLVKSGTVWFYCRRLKNYSIESFVIDRTVQEAPRTYLSLVVDVEMMLGFPSILIDVLLTSPGAVSPHNRDVEWINSTIRDMSLREPYLSKLYVRPFFNTLSEANEYTSRVQYPVDGVVAIARGGTDMKKIKAVKSMELQLDTEGRLCSREGTRLMLLQNPDSYAPGSILEVRFVLDRLSIKVVEVFERPDKTSANDNSAIDSILASFSSKAPESMTRNLIWRWSNSLRYSIYKRAKQFSPTRSIVLDIGPGTGQSSEAYSELPECSFILVEPDETKCKMLCRRLRVKSYDKSPRSFIGAIPQLLKKTKRYHILNCTLQELMNDHACINNVSSVVKCAIACFSSQYIMECIDDLSDVGIKTIGCYYSYAGVSIGSSILKSGGVEMTRVSHDKATVKWGNDTVYDEPVVDDQDLPMTCRHMRAVDMVPLLSTDHTTEVLRACSHVRVLISD